MWKWAALFGVAYFLCAEAGRFLSVRDSTYISFWLPAGLYLAVLLMCASRAWPWLAAAAFAANLAFDLSHGTALAAALLFCVANAVQGLGGAWLVRRFAAERPRLATLRDFLGLMGYGALLSTALAAAIGAGTLTAFGLSGSFLASWKVWWGSTAMAILLLSPFLLAWSNMPQAERTKFTRPGSVLEAALLLLVLLAILARLLFLGQGVMAPDKSWLLFPLLWAALRFGPAGAATASLLTSVLIAYFTTQGHAGLTPAQVASGEYVFVMQSALVFASLVSLIPAIVLAERDRKMADLRELSRKLMEVEENERRSINRELHDRVGQNLSALQLNLGALRNELAAGAAPATAARLEDARALLETTSKQVRDVMAELRPAALDDYGLLAALRHHAAAVAVRLGISITVEGKDPAPRPPLAVETALFRIVQEALNNVAKHARARNVKVTLETVHREVVLTVADDGAGFAASLAPGTPSYGIATMRERAEAIDARLRIHSAPGRGTRVEVVLEAPA